MARGQKMQIITIENGRQIEDVEQARLARQTAMAGAMATHMLARPMRVADAPDRPSIRAALSSVETRIVEAVWTLSRLPDRDTRFVYGNGRCGLEYMQEFNDRFANAVADGGKWDQAPPRPSPPSSRAIDRMDDPLDWINWLPEAQGRLVTVAATTKRGDASRHVSWNRVRSALPSCAGLSIRSLQRRYDDGLRKILERLTWLA